MVLFGPGCKLNWRERFPSRRDHMKPRFGPATGFFPDPDFNVPVQRIGEVDQAFDGKSIKPPVGERRDLGLVRPQHLGRLGLGHVAVFDDADDGVRQLGLGEHFIGRVHVQVGENVAAAVRYLRGLFGHFLFPL